MISFELNEEQTLIRDMLSNFARDVLSPRARDIDESGTLPDDILVSGWELGLVAASIPEDCGGAGGGRSAVTSVIAAEELGSGCASLGAAILAPSLFINPLIDFGTDDQRKEFLPLFTGGEPHIASLGLHENAATFDPTRMMTVAKADGADVVLNGAKRYVPFADQASHFLVLARTGDSAGLDHVEAFIVPRDATGLTIQSETGTMGLRPLPKSVLILENVRVPAAMRLGGQAGADVRHIINSMRLVSAALSLGVCRSVTELAIPYAKDRVAFGEPIGKKQAIAFMLADMHTECDSMRWMIWKAASQLEQGLNASKATVLAQNYVTRRAVKLADDGLQIFGGHGFIRDLPLEMWLRNVRTLTLIDSVAAA